MLKFETVLWDPKDAVAQVEALMIGFETQVEIKTRPWKHDVNFTDVGVWTENIRLARYLVFMLGGRILKISPKAA